MKRDSQDQEGFVLVRKDVLPEALLKVLQVKKRLGDDRKLSVNQACREEALSRSAYYKYRDALQPYRQEQKRALLNIVLVVEAENNPFIPVLELLNRRKIRLVQFGQSESEVGFTMMSLAILTAEPEQVGELLQQLRGLRGVREAAVYPKPEQA